MPPEPSPLKLDVLVGGAALDISIINTGSGPTRVWDFTNSWGWETLSLEVKVSPVSGDRYPLTVEPVAFTRNGPGFSEIPAGGTRHFAISGENRPWNGIEPIGHLRGETLWLRACLRIPPSPEAATYRVFVGEVRSPLRESEPPHGWLFSST